MARKKTTVYIEDDILRAAKVAAARNGKKDYEVFEEALRSHLGLEVLESVWERSDLGGDEAMELAVSEIHTMREEKRGAGRT